MVATITAKEKKCHSNCAKWKHKRCHTNTHVVLQTATNRCQPKYDPKYAADDLIPCCWWNNQKTTCKLDVDDLTIESVTCFALWLWVSQSGHALGIKSTSIMHSYFGLLDILYLRCLYLLKQPFNELFFPATWALYSFINLCLFLIPFLASVVIPGDHFLLTLVTHCHWQQVITETLPNTWSIPASITVINESHMRLVPCMPCFTPKLYISIVDGRIKKLKIM